MGNKKIAFNVDNETLHVSSRIFSFILENTQKIYPDLAISEFQAILDNVDVNESENEGMIDGRQLIQFFKFCIANKLANDDFYAIGNKIHEIHFSLISLLFRLNFNFTVPIINEINFIKVSFNFQEDILKLKVEIPNLHLLDSKEVGTPMLKWINGFIDRLFQIYLGNKPRASYSGDAIIFSYNQYFASKFDIVRYVSNEQFFFSRLKNYFYKREETGVEKKVEFYLFKDISYSIEEIASEMDLSVRALQRKLKEEGDSFRKLKEGVRKALSEKYLSDPNLNIQEISELLAYSERSAFEKAFKKWYGENPKVFRKNFV